MIEQDRRVIKALLGMMGDSYSQGNHDSIESMARLPRIIKNLADDLKTWLSERAAFADGGTSCLCSSVPDKFMHKGHPVSMYVQLANFREGEELKQLVLSALSLMRTSDSVRKVVKEAKE